MANEPKFIVYQDRTKPESEWRWRFIASNGKTIAMSSESYKNQSDCEHSRDIIQKESPNAKTTYEFLIPK